MQVDQKLNQTNGGLQKSKLSQKLGSPVGQFSKNWILSTLQYLLLVSLLSIFMLTVSSDALSMTNSSTTLSHSHLHPHRRLNARRFTAIPQVLPSTSPINASMSFLWTTITTTTFSKNTSIRLSTNFLSSQTQTFHSNAVPNVPPSSQSYLNPSNDSLIISKQIRLLKSEKLIDMKHNSGARNVNISDNSTSNSSDLYNSSWNIHLIWYTVFGVMIVVGLVANLLVVGTISGNKSLHTITNCFLLNLTVSDLLTLIFNANFNLYFLLTGHWPFGRVFCVVNNFITNLTIFSSVCTIMFTSKERYVTLFIYTVLTICKVHKLN